MRRYELICICICCVNTALIVVAMCVMLHWRHKFDLVEGDVGTLGSIISSFKEGLETLFLAGSGGSAGGVGGVGGVGEVGEVITVASVVGVSSGYSFWGVSSTWWVIGGGLLASAGVGGVLYLVFSSLLWAGSDVAVDSVIGTSVDVVTGTSVDVVAGMSEGVVAEVVTDSTVGVVMGEVGKTATEVAVVAKEVVAGFTKEAVNKSVLNVVSDASSAAHFEVGADGRFVEVKDFI